MSPIRPDQKWTGPISFGESIHSDPAHRNPILQGTAGHAEALLLVALTWCCEECPVRTGVVCPLLTLAAAGGVETLDTGVLGMFEPVNVLPATATEPAALGSGVSAARRACCKLPFALFLLSAAVFLSAFACATII